MSRFERIEKALKATFEPSVLLVEDESYRHHVPEGAESHFRVVMVCQAFEGQSRIKRHQMVNACLEEEFALGLHALSLQLFTQEEYAQKVPLQSPACANSKE